ncbi:MAG: GxxExxY protein [Deltaproteobacteria bacterium]|nr:GxxExxY protein [Deltaproteobacteria bacterium]
MSHEDTKATKQRAYWPPTAAAEEAAHAVIGAAIEVHRQLGAGYLEGIYERALAIELKERDIQFQRQISSTVSYRGISVGEHRIDLIVADEVIVELKAVESLSPTHRSQVISYLRVCDLRLGLLINFNVPVLQQGIRRVLWSP